MAARHQAAAAAAATNPFAGAPTFEFQLDYTQEKMAKGFSRLMRELQLAVATQSKRDNGTIKEVTHPLGYYRVLLTPDKGFFAVLLRPPHEMDNEGRLAEGVKFLYSFCNLYLLGFEHDNVCYLFHDADLGQGIDIDTNPWLRRMRFKGSYRADHHKNVYIAVEDLVQTYLTLLHLDDNTPDDDVFKALYRMMVTVSEPLRFAEWLKELMFIYRNRRTNPAVDQDGGAKFSDTFHDWDNRSNAVLDGEAAFEGPKYGFDTYDSLLSCSGVCLSRSP